MSDTSGRYWVYAVYWPFGTDSEWLRQRFQGSSSDPKGGEVATMIEANPKWERYRVEDRRTGEYVYAKFNPEKRPRYE